MNSVQCLRKSPLNLGGNFRKIPGKLPTPPGTRPYSTSATSALICSHTLCNTSGPVKSCGCWHSSCRSRDNLHVQNLPPKKDRSNIGKHETPRLFAEVLARALVLSWHRQPLLLVACSSASLSAIPWYPDLPGSPNLF